MYHILVVDDDSYILDVFHLIAEDIQECKLYTAINIRKAREFVKAHSMDLVFLDLVFPDTDGYEILKELKQQPHTTDAYFTLMSADKHDLLHRLRSYQLEAQDFIAKPFDIHELELKLRSQLKFLQKFRPQVPEPGAVNLPQQAGRFLLEPQLCRIQADGQVLSLTPLEYRLLSYLLQHPATVFTAGQLIAEVWANHKNAYRITDLNLRTLVHKVRAKIEPDPANPVHLLNARSHGYLFDPAGA